MALSRGELGLRNRKEGSEIRRQCVEGRVEQEEDRERQGPHDMVLGVELLLPLITCHGKSQPLQTPVSSCEEWLYQEFLIS